MSIATEGLIRVIISIIVIIVLFTILIRFRSSKNPPKTSLDILQERRNRGEITEKQYEEARKQQGQNKKQ